MVYSSNSHLSGSTITAAHAENWETQYTEVKKTYMERFSTASTATTLLSVGSTYTLATITTNYIMSFVIPPGFQNSRFEFSVQGQRLSTSASNVWFYFIPNVTIDPASFMTSNYPRQFVLNDTFTTASTGKLMVGSFSGWGGHLLSLAVYNSATTDGKFWNWKISGTSTTLSDISQTFVPWSTVLAGIRPTSTG